MLIASGIPKVTDAHSEYIIHTAFTLQQWLHKDSPTYRYMYCASPLNVTIACQFHVPANGVLIGLPRVEKPRFGGKSVFPGLNTCLFFFALKKYGRYLLLLAGAGGRAV